MYNKTFNALFLFSSYMTGVRAIHELGGKGKLFSFYFIERAKVIL